MWTYDNAGNITSKKTYAYTTGTLGTVVSTVNYVYGNTEWGDLLTTYNGTPITYDTIGNPLSDGTWNYSWTRGRRLTTMAKSGITCTFAYDANGMRTRRIVSTSSGTTTYTYTYSGSQLTHMTVGGYTLHFYYDANGYPMSVVYNGTTYYYATNLQGDVVAIIDGIGVQVVGYTYDAWGRLLSTTGGLASTLGTYNPLRYRGYVYDQETQLYYLQSRYYNPEWGRFLNADALVATGQGLLGNNMFAYCGNDPVNKADPTGCAFVNIDWDFDGLPNSLFPEFGAGFAGGNAVVAATKSDPVYQYITNTNEQTVINAKYFAFYKGKLAIKLPIKNNAAFYGCMFIGNDVTDETTIRHEYGHSLQWEKRGGLLYTCNIAIPSVIGNIVDRFDKLAYDYYTSPWEAEADQLGGVERQIVGDPWTEEYNSLWAFIKMLLE